MTYETMLIILAGGSAKVAKAFEKAIKPYVTETRVVRQK
jgi:hypothetical protein